MSTSKPQSANKPEKKIGPFGGGMGVTIWLNTIKTKDGNRKVRSITINPRRYKDQQGKWQDSNSYRVSDLPALNLALQEYIYTTPLPGDAADVASQAL